MNPWMAHLKAYRKKHPGKSLKQAMQGAKKSYSKTSKAKASPQPKAKGKKRQSKKASLTLWKK